MAGYTRQDTANNIANGNVIDADDFDAEYNAVEAAFNASTGHKHDGTAGEGAPIEKVGPSQDLIVSSTDVLPKTTNTLDLGSMGVQFKNGYFDGTLSTDVLTVDESATVGTTLGVTGATTLSDTLAVTGNTTVGGTLGVTGATGVDGNFDVNTDKFTVASATGNTAIAGTLGVTGASTLAALSATTIAASGTVGVGGNLNVNTDKFTVSGVNGNTSVAGTLAVAGTSAFTGAITATGGVSGALSGNATTATSLQNARNFSLTGDVTATAVSFDGSGNVELSTAMANNSVDLGTHTTGNYMVGVTGGTGVTVTHTPGEGSTATIAIAQDVSTTSNVQFNNLTVDGNLTVSGSTTTVNSETINLADSILTLNSNLASNEEPPSIADGGININRGSFADKSLVWDESEDYWTVGAEEFVAGTFTGNLQGDVKNTAGTTVLDSGDANTAATFTGNAATATALASGQNFSLTGDVTATAISFDGTGAVALSTTIADNSVALGTQTTGNYMVGVTGGNAIDVTHTASEGSTATINHADTSTQTDVTNTGNAFIQSVEVDDYGHVTSLSSGSVTVGDATITITAGNGLVTGGSFTTNASTNKTITIDHQITTTQASVNNSNGNVIQDVSLDTYGHITGLTSTNLDNRYYTETESDARFAAIAGDANQNFSANTLTATTVTGTTVNATTVDLGNWTVTESGGVLYFATGGTNKMKLDASGNLTVTGNVTAYGTV